MAVISVTKGPRSKVASLANFERTYRQEFFVQCDDMNDGPQIADGVAVIPALGTTYESGNDIDPACVVNSRSTQEMEPLQVGPRYQITVEWSNKASQQPNNEQGQNGNDNPLDRPKIIGLRFEKEMVPVVKDVNGGAIKNTAGDPFTPPIMVTRSRPIITIQKNESDLNAAQAEAAIDHVGQAGEQFFGVKGSKCLLRDITAQQQIEGNYLYYQKTYEVAVSSTGWDLQVENRGFMELLAGSTTKRKILDSDGISAIPTPAFLKSDGSKAASSSDSTALGFTVYKSFPLSSLGLE